jgi:cyclophilin family peptidyl-prolyl cis-trans isomerase
MRSIFVFVTAVCVLQTGCRVPAPAVHPSEDALQQVLSARSERDAATLLGFATHADAQVAETAWRALGNVAVADTDSLLAMALRVDSAVASFALSTQTWSALQLERMRTIWRDDPTRRTGLCVAWTNTQNREMRRFLLDQRSAYIGSDAEASCAMALNRQLLADPPGASLAAEFVEHALQARDPLVRRAWLYGLYRVRATWLDAPAADRLYAALESPEDHLDPFSVQNLVHLLGKHRHPRLPALLATEGPLVSDTNLRIEAVRAIFRYERFDHAHRDALRHLLRSALDDGHVPVALEILNAAASVPAAADIRTELADMVFAEEGTHEAVRMAAMRIAGQRPVRIPANPALTLDYIRLMGDSSSVYAAMAAHPDPIRALLTLQAMVGQLPERPEWVDILFHAMGHPEAVVADYALSQLRGQGYWSNAQEQDMAERVRDLERRTAKTEGVYVPRASIIGRKPVWTLDTSEGRIVIELDGTRAPASVSAIIELTRSGYYDGSFFHRVIANFVAQAGYSFSGDRLDAPFTLPTEAIEGGFERGRVGVASLGRDTEGGQFFIMHQWMPHLDGGYSNVGRVIEGMDVVDRVWQGTLIRNATIRLP